MSSDLKDARWQLAEDMATRDGFDWFKIGPIMKNGYLEHAQSRLNNSDNSEIERLAHRFRTEN